MFNEKILYADRFARERVLANEMMKLLDQNFSKDFLMQIIRLCFPVLFVHEQCLQGTATYCKQIVDFGIHAVVLVDCRATIVDTASRNHILQRGFI